MLDEGVLETVADANVGSILGIGYPAWKGGVLQYANQYEGGLAGFVARARELAERYGDRFTPPASLVALAEQGGTYTIRVRRSRMTAQPQQLPAAGEPLPELSAEQVRALVARAREAQPAGLGGPRIPGAQGGAAAGARDHGQAQR